jgi:serine/threonine protein kinase
MSGAAAAPSAGLGLDPASSNEAIKSSYSKLAKIGEGTYAAVFLAQHVPTGRKVAIKKIKVLSSKDGLDVTAIREVRFLKELKHPNVIQVSSQARHGSNAPGLITFRADARCLLLGERHALSQLGPRVSQLESGRGHSRSELDLHIC